MSDASIDLYWLPIGAGGHFVRWNGRIYERLAAARERRRPCDLYHSALLLHSAGTTYAVEMGPVWNVAEPERGVVCEGPVGARCLGRFRAFRYEVRCWPGGSIPDLAEAVGGAHRVTEDPAQVAAVLALVRQVPPLTWGRDELGTGEMWNSNSMVSWALARSGHDMAAIRPPSNGRAPGWRAGLCLANSEAAAPCDAGPMVFNMNIGGGQSIFAQSSTRLNEVDAELRDKHTGQPAEDIKPLAVLALRRIGVSLPDAELVAYAHAVSRGEKYQFHLG